jgi:hypothetical protein
MNFRITVLGLFLILLLIGVPSCNITRNVPEGRYLLVQNKLEIPDKTKVNEGELRNVIRQRPNHRTLGIDHRKVGFRLKLRAYNAIDSTKAAESRKERFKRYQKVNRRRLKRQKRINERRIERALKKGETTYKPKDVELKDTINPKPTFRNKIKYGYGEPPKVLDTTTTKVSQDQLELFLQKKGYFNASVRDSIDYDEEKRTATVYFKFEPRELYYVDSLYLVTSNKVVKSKYQKYIKEGNDVLKTPFRYDTEKLGEMRKSLSSFMRNESIYGFRESYVNFVVDTLGKGTRIDVALKIAERKKDSEDSLVSKPFDYFKIEKVYFHLKDTFQYDGNFYQERIVQKGRSLSSFDNIPTFDTMRYTSYEGNNEQFRTATFLYNEELPINPELLEFQNYLEENNYYKGEYVSQSYSRLLQTELFQSVQSEIIENDDYTLDVHYYLVPQKKQQFSFEPKGTHSNSFLGVAASVSYINKNLFKGGERLKISFSGGFESQPPVFDDNEEATVINDETRSFNTIEFGPSIELDVPGLFPIRLSKLSKRQNPHTNFSVAYNFQMRPEFDRQVLQLNYLWKFYDVFRTQVFTIGIPFIGGVQFVSIQNMTEAFSNRLEEQNDLFLENAYSNQSIWKDLKVSYQWTNREIRESNFLFSYRADFDMAGMMVGLLTKNKPVNDEGFKEFVGLRYSQFVRLDNEFRLHHFLENENSLNYRLQIGGGLPMGNNGPNLPFDYSFSAGGSNDNRGFRARSLGPGTYKYYLDKNRTVTEIADIRLGGSAEYRFRITDLIKGAIFSDFGNIWTVNEDKNRVGGQISKDFYKELSLSGGLGLRFDLSFLILRFDFGMPLRNPALPKGAQWIFQDDDPYIQEGINVYGTNSQGDYLYKELMPNPFQPQFHIGIGYPF